MRFTRSRILFYVYLGFIVVYSIGFVLALMVLIGKRPEIHSTTWIGTIVFVGLLYLGGAYVVTELVARSLLRRVYPILCGQDTGEAFRMEPHIFAHFVPSNLFPDVRDHFRVVSHPTETSDPKIVYLAGDCTLFEGHLDPQESMVFQLSTQLKDCRVLNAGAPHYTALHAYHRLVFDIVRGYRPNVVMLFSGANDVLSFIHHTKGFVDPAHTHMHRPWLPFDGFYKRIPRIPTASLKLLFAYFTGEQHDRTWDHFAESTSKVFFQKESVKIARELFNTLSFISCLELFASTCKAIGAEFVPTTFYYNAVDMQEEPRKTYAWGIDQINVAIRKFARADRIKLIDLAAELDLLPEHDISNKWHYTRDGNEKRACLLKKHLSHVSVVMDNA